MAKKVYLIRHGQTEWTKSGQHTGLTDIPLTEEGRKQAVLLRIAIEKIPHDLVLCSPLKRAKETCELAGLGAKAEITHDLVEWNYGKYEGLTSQQIKKIDPSWQLFEHGAPEGESIHDIQKRADRVLEKIHACPGIVILFSSGHFSRALIARWVKLDVEKGKLFVINPASISVLGHEHNNNVIIELNNCSYTN